MEQKSRVKKKIKKLRSGRRESYEYVYVEPENQVPPVDYKPMMENTEASQLPTSGLVELPHTIEIPGAGPEISKFQKRKKKAKKGRVKVFQDAAHSCAIEVDDNGHTTSVMLSDDLAKTYVKFGKEEQFEMDPITVERSSLVPITPKRKAFQRVVSRDLRWIGEHMSYLPIESMASTSQNKHYKKIKIKKTKLKGKKAASELLFAADRADLIVDEHCDKIGKIYVAMPDKFNHKTYLYALPERLNLVAEEYTKEIPIRRAADKRADWYVQDTSSEESEYEDDIKPLTTEAGALAVDDQMPVTLVPHDGADAHLGFISNWPINETAPKNTRLVLT